MQFITLFLGVLLLNLFAYITIKLRPKIFKVKVYRPMLWNFKMSVLPLIVLLISMAANIGLSVLGRRLNLSFLWILDDIVFYAGLLIWLLLLPNSGYLITELNLSHRVKDEKEVPIWYDIVSVFSFALSGVVNTLANIALIQIYFLVIVFDPQRISMSHYAALFLSGLAIILLIVFGIYLGRSIRFNSWDILHMRSFFKKLKAHFSKQGVFKEVILYVIFNTVFFLIMYVVSGIPFYFTKYLIH